jgi:hypothetical protein
MMKNAYEVLRFKEMEMIRLRKEVDSLRTVIPLLEEDALEEKSHPGNPDEQPSESQATGTEGPVFAVETSESKLWSFARRLRDK